MENQPTLVLSETQQRIGHAALRLIAENGFKATTTKQIAEAAQVNESTLFKCFKHKKDIFLVTWAVKAEQLYHRFENFTYEKSTVTENIHELVRFLYHTFIVESDMILILLKELGNHSLALGENSLFETTIAWIKKKLVDLSPCFSAQATILAFTVVSSVVFFVVDHVHNNILTDEFEDHICIDEIAAMVITMLDPTP